MQEEILKHNPLQSNSDLAAINKDDTRALRRQDTEACVDLWSVITVDHGGVHSRFSHLHGSISFGLINIKDADSKTREVSKMVSRAAHKCAVRTPVVMIVMFRSRLLGSASMDQVVELYTLICVESPLSWYVTHNTSYQQLMCMPTRKQMCAL